MSISQQFNVLEDPPDYVTPPPRPNVLQDEHFNRPMMQSSRESTIELHLSGSTNLVALPLGVPPCAAPH